MKVNADQGTSDPTPKPPGVHDLKVHGSLRQRQDGNVVVQFERRLEHPLRRVWDAIAEPAQRAVWCPGIRFDPKPAARFDIWFGEDCEGEPHVVGQLTDFNPPHSIALGSIRAELRRAGEGGCLLAFSDVLWFDDKRSRQQFANAVLAGWHQFLDRWQIWLDEQRAAPRLAEVNYADIDVPGRELL